MTKKQLADALCDAHRKLAFISCNDPDGHAQQSVPHMLGHWAAVAKTADAARAKASEALAAYDAEEGMTDKLARK